MPVPEPLRPPDTSIEPGRPVERFAARAAGMTASEIRALFAVASRPEVVSLAGGMPNLAALPLDALPREVAELVARDGQVRCSTAPPGRPGAARADLRGDGAGGHPGRPERRRRHRRLADGTGPGHPHLLRPRRRGARRRAVLRGRARQLRGVPGTGRARRHGRRTGWSRSRCATRCGRCGPRAIVPKFLYTIPNFHNPAGVTLAVERRRAGARHLRASTAWLVLEDNPYGLLGFTGEGATRRCGRWIAGVIYLGTFSKTFASGPAGRLDAGAATRCGTSWCSPPSPRRCARRAFNQLLVSRYLAAHDWRGQVKTFTEVYRERRDAMLAALEAYLPDGSTLERAGRRLLRVAHRARGRRHEGDAAAGGRPPGSPTRPAPASTPTGSAAGSCGSRSATRRPERITEGVRRLAGVLEDELDVVRTFGSAARPRPSIQGPQAPSPDTT